MDIGGWFFWGIAVLLSCGMMFTGFVSGALVWRIFRGMPTQPVSKTPKRLLIGVNAHIHLTPAVALTGIYFQGWGSVWGTMWGFWFVSLMAAGVVAFVCVIMGVGMPKQGVMARRVQAIQAAQKPLPSSEPNRSVLAKGGLIE
jgi:uncharacterized membrane protein